MAAARERFLEAISAGGPGKVHVYNPLFGIDGCGTYVHAKTWIFDDRFAIIGSANCNRRSLTHDSESSAGIYDGSNNNVLTYTFAHRLRIKLWAHHLGLDDERGYAELADGVASADEWSGGQGVRISESPRSLTFMTALTKRKIKGSTPSTPKGRSKSRVPDRSGPGGGSAQVGTKSGSSNRTAVFQKSDLNDPTSAAPVHCTRTGIHLIACAKRRSFVARESALETVQQRASGRR
jgi:hypothetical protein